MPVGGILMQMRQAVYRTKRKQGQWLTVRAHANSKALLQATILAAVAIMLRDWTLLVASA